MRRSERTGYKKDNIAYEEDNIAVSKIILWMMINGRNIVLRVVRHRFRRSVRRGWNLERLPGTMSAICRFQRFKAKTVPLIAQELFRNAVFNRAILESRSLVSIESDR